VTGDDLIAMNLTPGPRFKEILTRVEDEQLEGRLTTRQQAIDFIKEHFGLP
jgi:poly(A) polymerase